MQNKSFGYTDTARSTPATVQLSVPDLNYDSDFAVKSNVTANGKVEVKLFNQTTPLGQEEMVRFGVTDIADIFKGTEITSVANAISTKGVKLLAQLTETLRVTDSTVPDFIQEYPFSVQLVITAPKNEHATDALIMQLVTRLVGTLYEHGTPKILTKMKGGLTPKEL